VKVLWTARSRTRLAEIYDYIAPHSSARALGVVDRLLVRSEQLSTAPRSGTALSEFANDDIRELLERPYRLIYRVSAEKIEILTVKHYRQRLVDKPEDF
jgi:plasmid stabilization system protein ParE